MYQDSTQSRFLDYLPISTKRKVPSPFHQGEVALQYGTLSTAKNAGSVTLKRSKLGRAALMAG